MNVFSQQKTSVQPVKASEILQEQLLQKIQYFTEAWGKSDTVALSKLLTDEYQHSDVWGKILHKQDWLTFAAAPRKVSDIVTTDVSILLYTQNIAVITGKISYKFGEEKIIQELRFTQVWTNYEGQWKRALFQATLIDTTR